MIFWSPDCSRCSCQSLLGSLALDSRSPKQESNNNIRNSDHFKSWCWCLWPHKPGHCQAFSTGSPASVCGLGVFRPNKKLFPKLRKRGNLWMLWIIRGVTRIRGTTHPLLTLFASGVGVRFSLLLLPSRPHQAFYLSLKLVNLALQIKPNVKTDVRLYLDIESINALVEPAHHIAALPLRWVHPSWRREALQGYNLGLLNEKFSCWSCDKKSLISLPSYVKVGSQNGIAKRG